VLNLSNTEKGEEVVTTQQDKILNFNEILNHKVHKEITQSSQRYANQLIMTLCPLCCHGALCG